MHNKKKVKTILITAGPVWVPIDKVRVITTLFSGNLGIEIANQALNKKYKVILLYGPGRAKLPLPNKRLKIIRYKYFNELLNYVITLLKTKKIDIIIHSAAVADYKPKKVLNNKIKSGYKNLNIQLIPTIKIVDKIKKINKKVFLVKFKLEVNKSFKKLMNIAKKSMNASDADLIVANDFNTLKKGHEAFILNKEGKYYRVKGKNRISKKLLEVIKLELNK